MKLSFIMTILLVSTVNVLSSADNRALAQDQLCEVITSEEGDVEFVPCCEVVVEPKFPGRPDVISRTSTAIDGCSEVEDVLTRNSAEVLEQVFVKSKARELAKILREKPDSSINAFAIERPVYVYSTYCCTCVPGENCSVEFFWQVCTYTETGSCPSGTFRAICTYGDEYPAACSSID